MAAGGLTIEIHVPEETLLFLKECRKKYPYLTVEEIAELFVLEQAQIVAKEVSGG